MIKVNKVQNDLGMNDIVISKGNQGMMMLYDENDTLYWVIKDSKEPFEITKENYALYSLFNQLYTHILSSKVFQMTDREIHSCTTIEQLLKLKEQVSKKNEQAKQIGKESKLFNSTSISWCSDESAIEAANVLHISKIDDKIILNFETKNVERNGCISFKMKNSRYAPFQSLFLQLYFQLQNYEEEFHQIHIEEILYEKQLVKK